MSKKLLSVSNDGKVIAEIPFDKTFIKLSGLVSDMLEDDEENEDSEITMKYSEETINLCLKFCKLYDENPYTIQEEPVRTSDFSELVPRWCSDLLDLKPCDLLELVKMANFVDINILIDSICIKIATLIKGKNSEEIKLILNIQDEFSKEEKEEFVKSHQILESEVS
jgi:hypothetical protein